MRSQVDASGKVPIPSGVMVSSIRYLSTIFIYVGHCPPRPGRHSCGQVLANILTSFQSCRVFKLRFPHLEMLVKLMLPVKPERSDGRVEGKGS